MANNGNPTGRELAAERRIKALEMRKAGASYRQISDALGISIGQAHNDVASELGKLLIECGAETIEPAQLRQVVRATMALGIEETLKRIAPA